MKRNLSFNKQKITSQRANIYLWIGIAVFCFLGVLILQLMYFNKRRNTSLLQGQLALVSKNEETLKNLNETISKQLDQTKITLEEKEELLSTLYSSGKSTELPPEIMELSKREMEVLSYLALGWTDDQLAEKLFISKSTVKTHLRRIYSKLLVRGKAEAVAVAHKYNIVG